MSVEDAFLEEVRKMDQADVDRLLSAPRKVFLKFMKKLDALPYTYSVGRIHFMMHKTGQRIAIERRN